MRNSYLERWHGNEAELETVLADEQARYARAVAAGEIRLFEENLKTRESQKQQLKLRIEQLEEEITGLALQPQTKARENELIQRELEHMRMLNEKQLTPNPPAERRTLRRSR